MGGWTNGCKEGGRKEGREGCGFSSASAFPSLPCGESTKEYLELTKERFRCKKDQTPAFIASNQERLGHGQGCL